jgi:DeoR/GlpR family transcriptional regulator of sugar metabolism
MKGAVARRKGKPQRQDRIISALRLHPAMRVGELADLLDVSTETIRRDLAELDELGLINRTYGGAIRPVAYEPALAERQGLMVAERERIAESAAEHVDNNEILMIGGGATTLHFARRIAGVQHAITVITHAISIAVALAVNPLIKILMLPGQYDGREGLIHGAETVEALRRFRADKAFLGASGLTVEGASDAAMGPGLVYQTMVSRSLQTVVLADHTKFGRPSLIVYSPWAPTVTLISDQAPKGDLAAALTESGATLLVAMED